MDRRQFLLRSSLAAAGTMLPAARLFSHHTTAMDTFTKLRRGTGIFQERGGTIGWLVNDHGMTAVDSQYPEAAKLFLKGMQENDTDENDLLINTHHHGDHTGGNGVFRENVGEIIAHKNVPILMKQASEEDDGKLTLPDQTFEKNWKREFGDETIDIRYFGRAHTAGDSVTYFEKANVAHVGDLVFNRMNPYTDRPAGASIHNWIRVLGRIAETYPADTIYIFGHGTEDFGVTGSKQDLAVMRSYLEALVEYVQEGVEAGRSKEEILDKQEMEQFPQFQYFDWWKLSDNLEVVYNEITGKKWIEIN